MSGKKEKSFWHFLFDVVVHVGSELIFGKVGGVAAAVLLPTEMGDGEIKQEFPPMPPDSSDDEGNAPRLSR